MGVSRVSLTPHIMWLLLTQYSCSNLSGHLILHPSALSHPQRGESVREAEGLKVECGYPHRCGGPPWLLAVAEVGKQQKTSDLPHAPVCRVY